jgi:glycosyltransferase involved in cell wall biosynthesis
MNKGWTNTFYRAFERNAVAATKKAGMIISSSSETTASLINDYDIKSVATIPFGANLDTDFINYKEKRIQKDKPIHFLFIGREWERKGGEETVLICDELIKKDLEIKLTIVGCKVPETFKRNYILHYEFIDKNIPAENSILKNLLEDAHFLIVLPKAEMYGIVFCEAAAYALPSITRAVGGIKDIVKDNITGISLNRSATIEDYTKRIMQLINDPQSYKEMSKNARSRFEEKLNWDTFTLKLTEQIQEKFKLQ